MVMDGIDRPADDSKGNLDMSITTVHQSEELETVFSESVLPCRSLTPSIVQLSVGRFMWDFTTQESTIHDSFFTPFRQLSILPDYGHAFPIAGAVMNSVLLQTALAAAAYANFAARNRLPWLKVEALKQYGKAIGLVHSELQGTSTGPKEHTLAAIWLLAVCEVCTISKFVPLGAMGF